MNRMLPLPALFRSQRKLLVCIVDPNAEKVSEWTAATEGSDCELSILTTAAAALRMARTHTVDLWVVNTNLPGLSGCELCSMLRSRSSAAPVYLVADEYTPTVEQAAWRARATAFGVNQTGAAWLRAWLDDPRTTARRRSQAIQHASN